MKIIIEGKAKEIAGLVKELQGRQGFELDKLIDYMDNQLFDFTNSPL